MDNSHIENPGCLRMRTHHSCEKQLSPTIKLCYQASEYFSPPCPPLIFPPLSPSLDGNGGFYKIKDLLQTQTGNQPPSPPPRLLKNPINYTKSESFLHLTVSKMAQELFPFYSPPCALSLAPSKHVKHICWINAFVNTKFL